MRHPALLGLAAALLASAAGAVSISSTDLIWAAAPSFQDMQLAWPYQAGDLTEGTAVLACRVKKDASIGACETVSEAPAGRGFARAAKGLASRFKLRIDMKGLRADRDYFVNVPFRFINPSSAAGHKVNVSDPRWISMPDPGRVQAAFPKAAADAGVRSGVGVVDCTVAADGRLRDCSVSRESPAGLGFGEAALSVAPIMQMNPWTDEGRPVDGARIKLPFSFKLAGAP